MMSTILKSGFLGRFMNKYKKHFAFTLIELLIVVSIMIILAGVAPSVLIKSRSVYQFRQYTHAINGMVDLARNNALNKINVPAYANPQNVDTNFDGASDLIPFAYVFEIAHGVNGNLTLRVYADFNDSSPVYNTSTDYVLETHNFNSRNLYITYEGKYDITSAQNITEPATGPSQKTYSISYATDDGALSMNRYTVSSAASQALDLLSIRMRDPALERTATISLFTLSGAPYFFE